MNTEAAEFLHKIGVDTRFVSILDEYVFINNLKFSRFSRRKEELFLRKFPYYKVIRSKLFQKICTRASRVLKNVIQPRDKIFLLKNQNCFNFTLYAVLESYTRKYGIELIFGDCLEDATGSGADSIALPITLDDEAESIVELMLKGEKIKPLSFDKEFGIVKVICPIVNVPRPWIISWLEKYGLECTYENKTSFSKDLIQFLEEFIPDVKENMLKSAKFVYNEVE